MKARKLILSRLQASQQIEPRGSEAAPKADIHTLLRMPEQSSASLSRSFSERFTALKGELYSTGTVDEASACLLSLLKAQAGALLCEMGPLLRELASTNSELERLLASPMDKSLPASELSHVEIGISEADCLSAQTGSILLRSARAGGRRLSVLPPFHLVVARESQISASFHEWFADLKRDPSWSSACIITGPSRTADIEKILVLGAHGPKRLALILLP